MIAIFYHQGKIHVYFEKFLKKVGNNCITILATDKVQMP